MAGSSKGTAALAVLGALLVGCATPAQVEDALGKKAQGWGDRTFINAYRFAGPIAAYFEPPAPGATGGRLIAWDEGRRDLVQGEWAIRNFKLCVKPNVYYKEMMMAAFDREACLGFDSNALQFDHFKGDVFGLKGRKDAPYVTSKADNDKFVAVMRSTPYYAPANGGFSEGLYPARDAARVTAEPVVESAAQ